MVAYVISNADRDNVGNKYYNGRPTIQTKVRLAAESLSGIMIWELGQDSFTEYSLLETIHKKYTDLVPNIIEKYNGKILARGGNFKVLEGTDQFHRFVIIEFPSLEEGERCWSSKEYQKASSFRKNGSGVVDLILVESGDATK